MLKYWFKIINSENVLLKTIYNQALKDSINGNRNWVSNIKKLLDDYGFSYVFDNPHIVDINMTLNEFKHRIIDTYKQEWFRVVSNSSSLDMYRIFKTQLMYENYLDLLPRNCRLFLTRLRLSVHPLRIQVGRYARNNIPRNERYCICCNMADIEDEYHFVCKCPCFENLRKNI